MLPFLVVIMITPFAVAIIREGLAQIPWSIREAIHALGLPEVHVYRLYLSYIKNFIYAGIILAMGRAMGETIAVSLVIGNVVFNPILIIQEPTKYGIFRPGYTISSLIADQFPNAAIYTYMTHALYASAFILFVIGLIINIIGLKFMRRI